MTSMAQTRTTTMRRALLGALAALTLTLGGLAASASDASAGSMGGGVRDVAAAGGMGGGVRDDAAMGRNRAARPIGEEIPTLRGGLGGDSGSIVIPQ